MEVEQKISTNVEILQFIFKKLILKDQIQVISVSKEFEYVIENFIWKWKFNEITILEHNDAYYIEFKDAADNKYDLTETECHTFFPVIAKHVKKLIVESRNKDKLTDLYNFENLILLEFKYSILTEKNLKSLAINCPKLETINFMYSQNFNSSTFDLNKRGQIEILGKVKSLKHLKIAANEIFDLSQLNEILNQFCLKSLSLESFLYKDEVDVVHLENCEQLEHLTITSCYEAEAWLQFEELYLKHFKNLNTLSLDGSEILLKDTNLSTLAECCNNLQELSLADWNLFIKEFPPKLKLKKLTLKNCLQLTWKNLQQILSELSLEEFVSDKNVYEGTRDFFYGTCNVADTLQVIDIKTKQNAEFLEFFKYVNKTPEKLKKFHYEYTKHSPFSNLKEFSTLCANVKEMTLTNVGISIYDLMKLQNLKSITFSIFPAITWSFLSTLLTHRSLENISLDMSDKMESKLNNDTKKPNNNDDDFNDDEDNEDNLNDFDLPILKNSCKKESVIYENCEINLQTLKIPFMIFLKHQNLFLDLLNFKTKLKLELYCYYNPEERLNQTFLNKLLTNKKFPAHIKYIKILNRYYESFLYKDEVEVVPLENCKQLENLTIKSCYEAEAWLQFEELYLKHFKNLTTLSLDGSDALLKDTNLLTLAECCNNLQELYLGCWNLFIQEFPLQLKLKKLTLKNCLQLTWQNLQQILCDLNLEEFVSDQSEYEGTRDFFYGTCIIADTLQVIDIKTKQNEEFLEFFKYVNKTPEKLKKFHYEYLKHTPFSTLREFATLCANVEDMSITNVGISIKDLMKLKNLKSLKFSIFPAISWSFLSTLLTHRTLENISLEMSDIIESKLNNDTKNPNNYGDDEDNLNDFDLPILKNSSKKESVICEHLKINLQTLKIPFMIFLKHQNLFLDLLNFKTKLKLELYCYYNPEERLNQTFLNKLLTSKKFPSHIKYIKILKRYYACSDLKDNFRTTVDDVSQNDGCLTVTL